MKDEAEVIARAVIDKAKGGDPTAMRLCIERIAPLRKGRPMAFPLPATKTPDDIVGALGAVVSLMAAGELSPEEAEAIASVVEIKRKAIETQEIDERLRDLEQRIR